MSEEEKQERLILSTKKSLYDPIEIEIDGQIYQTKKITRTVQFEVDKLDNQITQDNPEPLYKIVELLYGVNRKILEELDKREVETIYFHTKKKLQEIDRQRLKLIADTFGNLGQPEKQQVKKTIPNRKRPGGKA